ncbi:MAG: DUF262 domain-containing protein [Rhodocyclaceae bacterium]|nr:DUF262 domain-containing protein [Rhodocyclaceae bacterium]
MSAGNLLKTSDVTFLDLIGNGKKYRVPPFQRDYSWEEEQWEDLWNDIVQLEQSPDARHYMGALVVEAASDREFLVIDGQQRIATLSLLALAVIDLLPSLGDAEEELSRNRERAQGLRQRFIGEKDPASLLESSKLFLNQENNGFYQDYLVQLRAPNNSRKLSHSNSLLWKCFQWFRERLKEKNLSGEQLASLLSETVARKLLFILISVEDEISAYTVFETLNARGLELSSTDLLKNYLFSKIKVESDLQTLQRRWQKLMDTVRQEAFPDFLRYHLLCALPEIRKKRLFKHVREQVVSPQDVFDLLDALERRAELFAALNDSEHEYWQERPEAKPYIRELLLFRVKQMTPLLFVAFEKLDGANFVKTLKMVSVVSFRYNVISSLNPNALELAYHRAAKAVLQGQASGPAEIFRMLASIYVPDEKFQQDFEIKQLSTSGKGKKLAKYILCKLESDASGVARDFEVDAGSIEHILPENPSAAWDDNFQPSRQEDFIYRIGNLTLLESGLNREIGNNQLQEKLPCYKQSQYQLTQRISADYDDWTPAVLNARQKLLASRAVHIWRSDFA